MADDMPLQVSSTPTNAGLSSIAQAIRDISNITVYTADQIGQILYAQTAAETTAGVTIVDYSYQTGVVDRYGVNTTPGTTDMSAAIQAAIDVGGAVRFLDATYSAANLTADNDYQSFIGSTSTLIKKNANGPIITFSGNRNSVHRLRFDGNGATYTGHNIVKSGAHLSLDHCSSKSAESRAVYDSDGNGLRIIGTNDIYQTLDATSSGYDIEIAGSGLYSKITDIYTSQATGGLYFNQSGVGGGHQIVGGQFGKLTFIGGSGVCDVSNCRINGDITIEKSNVSIDLSSCSADATIGDTSTTFSGIVIGPSFIMQSGTTFTATAGLQDCVLYVLQLQESGVTVDYSALAVDNNIYTTRQSYTSDWTASSSNPSISDGTTSAYYQRSGKRVRVQITISMGASTTFGSGTWRHSLPFSVASGATPIGSARALDSGTALHTGVCTPTPGQSYATSCFDGAVSDTTSAVPHTWASGDNIYLDAEYYAG